METQPRRRVRVLQGLPFRRDRVALEVGLGLAAMRKVASVLRAAAVGVRLVGHVALGHRVLRYVWVIDEVATKLVTRAGAREP